MYATKFIETGHEVDAVSGAKEAIGKIKEVQYDVVLLDMIMPMMSGLDLLKEINALDLKGKTKFIILSNQSESADQAAAAEAGADGYIVKAESIPSDVVKQMEEICSRKKS